MIFNVSFFQLFVLFRFRRVRVKNWPLGYWPRRRPRLEANRRGGVGIRQVTRLIVVGVEGGHHRGRIRRLPGPAAVIFSGGRSSGGGGGRHRRCVVVEIQSATRRGMQRPLAGWNSHIFRRSRRKSVEKRLIDAALASDW